MRMTLLTDAMFLSFRLGTRGRGGGRDIFAHIPGHGQPGADGHQAPRQPRYGARVLRDRAARGSAEKGAEELHARVDARRRPRRLARGRPRHERWELRLQNVEGSEEDDERGDYSREARESARQYRDGDSDDRDGGEEHVAFARGRRPDDGWQHQNEAGRDRPQVDPPVL